MRKERVLSLKLSRSSVTNFHFHVLSLRHRLCEAIRGDAYLSTATCYIKSKKGCHKGLRRLQTRPYPTTCTAVSMVLWRSSCVPSTFHRNYETDFGNFSVVLRIPGNCRLINAAPCEAFRHQGKH